MEHAESESLTGLWTVTGECILPLSFFIIYIGRLLASRHSAYTREKMSGSKAVGLRTGTPRRLVRQDPL